MGNHTFEFGGGTFDAMAEGVLFWAAQNLLIVSDLHLGKSARMARRSGVLIPPYETTDTLSRLSQLIASIAPQTVICLGDSFDDLTAMDELSEQDMRELSAMMAGREWIWIEGNHDAGPVHIGGSHRTEVTISGITFRHIAKPGARAEVSGHYHPKAHLAGRSRPCFLIDSDRIIMPAFGTYTGGLRSTHSVFQKIMKPDALAVLTGSKTRAIPLFV